SSHDRLMTYDVLVYGPIFCDLIFTDLPEMPVLGTEIFACDFKATVGGSVIVAAGLHKLGARVGLIADLGNDPLSLVARTVLDDLGLDRALICEHPYPLPQVTVALSFPHDRAFITRFQRPATPPDLAALLRAHPARHLHVCSFLAALETPDACHIAHTAGMTISMDPGWDEEALRDTQLTALIAELDFFLPNESELCYLAGAKDVTQAAQQTLSAMRNGMIVVKQGAAGATAFIAGRRPVHADALPMTPVDTTGAGDAFDAGFLYSFLESASLERSLAYGAVCGGLSTTASGGVDALPTHTEVEKWLAKLPSSAAAAPTHPD
ncbi:MAG: carbohydrate kinase family protein, partial [Caldilinea sp.]